MPLKSNILAFFASFCSKKINTDKLNLSRRRPLRNISDSFKKIVIVKDNILPRVDESGIVTIGLKDFLLNNISI